MTETSTCGGIDVEDGGPIAATGRWAFDLTPRTGPTVRSPLLPRRLAGCLVLLAVSSFTSIADPWLDERRHRAQSSTLGVLRQPSRRRLSVAEARQMAMEVLYRAEEERAILASEEARRGINWEEVS